MRAKGGLFVQLCRLARPALGIPCWSTRWNKKCGFWILPGTPAPRAWHIMLSNGSRYFGTCCSQPWAARRRRKKIQAQGFRHLLTPARQVFFKRGVFGPKNWAPPPSNQKQAGDASEGKDPGTRLPSSLDARAASFF